MPAPAATKAAIQRAIEAFQAAGLAIGAVSVSRDGTVRIETPVEKTVDMGAISGQRLKPKKWATG